MTPSCKGSQPDTSVIILQGIVILLKVIQNISIFLKLTMAFL